MTFTDLETLVRQALARPLPGPDAQRALAPWPRRWLPPAARGLRRDAAGLLLLYPAPDPALVLTVRTRSLPQHGGQVSLPGGAVEPGETFGEAALREAREEIGLASTDVQLLGPLTPLDIRVSRFRLHPIVGATPARPRLVPATSEVARILEVPLAELRDPARFHLEQRRRDGTQYWVPYFRVDGEEVWGATAMVLAEFLWLIGWRPPEGTPQPPPGGHW